MKISFLIPSKNRLQLLQRCLHTIRTSNANDDYEIIVSDNASTDDYSAYIDRLADPRIVYIRQPEPVPVTENWCAALSRATGDYILMLGDDDALTPDFSSTVRPFLSSDGPDIVYLAAYHYCYPNVMPGSPAGYFAEVGCEYLPNENGAFCLLPYYARDLASSILQFRHRYGLNAQHFLIKRDFIDRLADVGPLYQGPYPDFFSAVVAFARARSIVVASKPSVIIGISPSSFGAYYFSSRHKEGYEFLANDQIDPDVLRALENSILPGDKNNTNWLIAAETARRALAPAYPWNVDVDRYTAIQINSILRYRYVDRQPNEDAIFAVQEKLSGKDRLLFEGLRAAIEAAADTDQGLASRLMQAVERRTGQYPSTYAAMIDIGAHTNITDAFNWLTDGTIARAKPLLSRPVAPAPVLQKALPRFVKGSSAHITTYMRLRNLARSLALRFLPPVRHLYERTRRSDLRIAALEADCSALRTAMEELRRNNRSSVQSGSTATSPADLCIVITRNEDKFVISPDQFDDFDFKHGDELSVTPPAEAAMLLRTPEQHIHVPLNGGYGIRVPPKMLFASFKGFSVPEHLVALTGAGMESLDSIGKSHIGNYAKHIGLGPDMTFLEVGSGIGRDAFQLIGYLNSNGRYIGIDVQRESNHLVPKEHQS